MKVWQKILIVLTLLVFLVGGLCYDTFYVAPTRFTVRYENISSEKIPAQLNDINILFFSDVHYNNYMTPERFQEVVQLINNAAPDIVVFVGDLFDHPSVLLPNEEVTATLTAQLKEINAPLGKFAVLGNHDLESSTTKELVTSVLSNANFEIITNRSILIRNKGSEAIGLVGLDSQLLGNPDITSAFANVSPNSFNIVVLHTPDIADSLTSDQVDLQVSGHSHGGQVYFPIFGSFYTAPYAEVYNKGKYKIDDKFILDVMNGVGTTKADIRFLSDPEVVMYRLQRKTTPTPTPAS
ncbi:MAG: metallophosphoesterase [Anaerorhabdus sp.]|uniref:metallophosphoesterase n=1 Tax=Anaerorhabdus sp. TaxID=1872524 RepID=UPI003A8B67C2